MKNVVTLLRQDPRVIRWTTTKLGERLHEVAGLKEDTVKTSKS